MKSKEFNVAAQEVERAKLSHGAQTQVVPEREGTSEVKPTLSRPHFIARPAHISRRTAQQCPSSNLSIRTEAHNLQHHRHDHHHRLPTISTQSIKERCHAIAGIDSEAMLMSI